MKNDAYTVAMRSSALMMGLAGIVTVHVLDLPAKMEEVPYIGFMYIGAILVAGILMYRMMVRPSRVDFAAAAVLAVAVIAGYVVNRTTGMPGAMDDIGNWWEPLGLLSLIIEAWVVFLGISSARRMSSVRGNSSTLPLVHEDSAAARADIS